MYALHVFKYWFVGIIKISFYWFLQCCYEQFLYIIYIYCIGKTIIDPYKIYNCKLLKNTIILLIINEMCRLKLRQIKYIYI